MAWTSEVLSLLPPKEIWSPRVVNYCCPPLLLSPDPLSLTQASQRARTNKHKNDRPLCNSHLPPEIILLNLAAPEKIHSLLPSLYKMAPISLEPEDHSRDAAFKSAMHGKSGDRDGWLAMRKNKEAHQAAVDEYFKHWDEKRAEDETPEIREVSSYHFKPILRTGADGSASRQELKNTQP